jgi:hypothetical protein
MDNFHLHMAEDEPAKNQDARDAKNPGKHIFHRELQALGRCGYRDALR